MLIVFDGIDGSGKATQIKLLSRELRKHKIPFAIFKYPRKKAKILHAHLNSKKHLDARTLFYLFARDIVGEQKKVGAALRSGKVVILDRYITSTLAYQGEEVSFAEGMRFVKEKRLLKPDLIVLLDLPPELALARKRKQKKPDRFESDLRFMMRVRKRFLQLAKMGFLGQWVIIDAGRNRGEVSKEINKLILHKILGAPVV